jgi:anti-anti-sigma factor
MARRSRHGLHVVPDGGTPAEPDLTPLLPPPGGPLRLDVGLHSVVLGVGGRLDADTAGRLRLFLSVFTVDGGPRELVLDLSGVDALDQDGMAPIQEADEAMSLRQASLRLVAPSPAVAHFLADAGSAWTLPCGPPPATSDGDHIPSPRDEV